MVLGTMYGRMKDIANHIEPSVNRQLIYNWPEQLFSEAGIASIEHADFDGMLPPSQYS